MQLELKRNKCRDKRIDVWPRAVDTTVFNPTFRSQAMRERMTDGNPDATILVYVGRLGAGISVVCHARVCRLIYVYGVSSIICRSLHNAGGVAFVVVGHVPSALTSHAAAPTTAMMHKQAIANASPVPVQSQRCYAVEGPILPRLLPEISAVTCCTLVLAADCRHMPNEQKAFGCRLGLQRTHKFCSWHRKELGSAERVPAEVARQHAAVLCGGRAPHGAAAAPLSRLPCHLHSELPHVTSLH